MTDERKNEIWAMLPKDFKKEIKELWELDTLPIHPNYDRDSVTEGAAYILVELFGSHNITAQAEEKPKEPNYIADTSKKVDYAQYRLDLAKEIAVAVIRSDRWDFHSCNPVEQANEIVKRLKETDNENA